MIWFHKSLKMGSVLHVGNASFEVGAGGELSPAPEPAVIKIMQSHPDFYCKNSGNEPEAAVVEQPTSPPGPAAPADSGSDSPAEKSAPSKPKASSKKKKTPSVAAKKSSK